MEEVTKTSLPELLYGVLARPTTTLRHLTEQRLWAWGVGLYLGIAVVNALLGTYGFRGFGGPPADSGVGAFSPGALFLTGFLPNLAFLLSVSGLAHLITSALGGRGSFRGVLAGLGFAALPLIFMAPFYFLAKYAGLFGNVVSGLASLALYIWVIVLSIIAIRENYALSTGRATAGCILSGCASIIVVGAVVSTIVVFVVLAAITTGGGIA